MTLTALARKGRPGTSAPEPSFCSSAAGSSRLGGLTLGDEDERDWYEGEEDDHDIERSLVGHQPLPQSLALSASQSAFVALSGARVSAHVVDTA